MPIDINANSLDRIRRNWQAASKGALTPFTTVAAPITNNGAIGLAYQTSTGLSLTNNALALLFSDASIVGSSTGIKVQESSTGGISTGANGIGLKLADDTLKLSSSGVAVNIATSQSGLLDYGGGLGIGVNVDGASIDFNGGGALHVFVDTNTINFSNIGGGLYVQTSSTGGLHLDTTGNGLGILIPSTGSGLVLNTSGLSVGTLTSTNLPGDVAYTDVANTFTSTQTFNGPSTQFGPSTSGINISSTGVLQFANDTHTQITRSIASTVQINGNLSVLGQITAASLVVSNFQANNLYYTKQTLRTTTSTVNIPSTGNYFQISPTQNFSLNYPNYGQDGQQIQIQVIQGATPRTMTLGSTINPGPFSVVLSSTANASDWLFCVVDPNSGLLDVVNFVKGY